MTAGEMRATGSLKELVALTETTGRASGEKRGIGAIVDEGGAREGVGDLSGVNTPFGGGAIEVVTKETVGGFTILHCAIAAACEEGSELVHRSAGSTSAVDGADVKKEEMA